MGLRNRTAYALLAVACVVAAAAATLAAQAHAVRSSTPRAWVLERTPDGHPDFQGVWANNTVTPLQRPKQWEGKTRLTDAEVAELQAFAARIVENDGDAQFGDGLILAVLNGIEKPISYDPGTGNYNQFWVVERDWHDRRTALVTDPPDGKIPPMTAEGQKRRAAEIEHRKVHAFEDPEVFPLGERCVNFGIPRVTAGYNSYIRIVQAPGYVMIMSEMAHDARIIPLDGRPRLDGRVRVWNGDARGRWEGDTLVIETTNFNGKVGLTRNGNTAPTSLDLRLVERLTRTDDDTIQYEATVSDPRIWVRPWKVALPLRRHSEYGMFEYACHEGNYAMPNILSGARSDEKPAR
jgi:hypothetical protein